MLGDDKQPDEDSGQADDQSGLAVSDSISLSEDEVPEPRPPSAIVSPDEYVKVAPGKEKRLYYFLCFVALACLIAIALRPNPTVEITATAIFTSCAALGSRYLLYNPNKNKNRDS